jgi:hypothetical protein
MASFAERFAHDFHLPHAEAIYLETLSFANQIMNDVITASSDASKAAFLAAAVAPFAEFQSRCVCCDTYVCACSSLSVANRCGARQLRTARRRVLVEGNRGRAGAPGPPDERQ